MVRFMDAGAEVRLKQYFERIGSVLGNKRRRESFAIYALGLFGDGERKSMGVDLFGRRFPCVIPGPWMQ